MDIDRYLKFREKINRNVSKVIIGKEKIIDLITVSFICSGHVLMEDIPGVGKTMLVKAFAKSIGCDFKRIQFTPDLLPSDLTGINYYNQKYNDFQFKKGPLFTNVILADEINRATPRTQSSLLEAMEERQITVDGETRKLDEPFIVLATQNPIESYGTFPLPEAQLDRFFMKVGMGYPARDGEIEMLSRFSGNNPIDDLQPVVDKEDIEYVTKNYFEVKVSDDVVNYIMDVVEATRNNARIQLGVSPRGTLALYRACQAFAAINGREFIIPEDVKYIVPYIFSHRIIIKGSPKGMDAFDFINSIVKDIKTPVEDI